MIPQQVLTAEDIRQTLQEVAQEHLPFEADGYICTSEMIYDVLMKAAIEGISIDAVCRDLEDSAAGNTIREIINGQVSKEQLRQHETELNEALADRLPAQLRKLRLEAAIDEHDEPFYGKTPELRTYAYRSRAKQGTTRFFRIASAYVIYRQLRLTLAVTFVLPEDETVDVVRRLYQRLQALKLHLAVLYLDRGYCSSGVITYLNQMQQPALLACTIRGKQAGTRKLCRGHKSYRTTHTFTDGATVHVAVVATCVPDKHKLRHRKWLLYVVLGLDWNPKTICRRYRFRFGIESSYRILRRVRIKTTSRNPAFRFFVLGFAILLANIWAFLRWFVARIPGVGPHRLARILHAAGHDALHTLDLPLQNRTPDSDLIRFAEQDERIVISKDADFVHSHILYGRPPKLLLISTGNLPNTELEILFTPQIKTLGALFEVHSFLELSRTTLVVHK